MEFTLNKSQRMVANAAAKEDSRPVLTCVHIRKGIIEAANGFMAVQSKIDYDGDEKLLLKAKDVARLKGKLLTFQTEGTGMVDSPVTGEVRVTGSNLPVILQAQPGEYPDLEKLHPQSIQSEVLRRLSNRQPFKIALSREQLLNVLLSNDVDTIKFSFWGGLQPVEFETENSKGMIMPIHISDWSN